MDKNFKKLLPFAGVLCSCLLGSLSADSNMSQQPPAGQINDQDNGRYREITPSAGPRVADGVDVYVSADFIYWTPRMEGLGYVMSGYGDGTTAPNPGSMQNISWKWEPGFKVGLGLMLGHDGFDMGVEYTWLQTSKTNSVTANTDSAATDTLFPTWNPAEAYTNPSPSDISAAEGHWKLHFNVIDLEMGRNMFLSQYLKLRPHVGFKGAWQDLDYNVKYTFDVTTTSTRFDKMAQTQNWWGFGLRMGMDMAWHFTKEFSVFADFAFSELWSQYKVSRKDTQQDATPTAGTATTVINTKNNFHTVMPVMEMDIGLRWETWFSDDDYHFMIQAGWEEQIWINHNQLLALFEQGSHGDMSLQGLTIKLRFDF